MKALRFVFIMILCGCTAQPNMPSSTQVGTQQLMLQAMGHPTNWRVSIAKQQGNYYRVNVSGPKNSEGPDMDGPGWYALLKSNLDGTFKVLFEGNGDVACSDMIAQGVPSSVYQICSP